MAAILAMVEHYLSLRTDYTWRIPDLKGMTSKAARELFTGGKRASGLKSTRSWKRPSNKTDHIFNLTYVYKMGVSRRDKNLPVIVFSNDFKICMMMMMMMMVMIIRLMI